MSRPDALSMPRICDAIVVGAGFSGLAAALDLHRAGWDVRVLEARNRLGGRAKPGTLAGRVTVDLGGQWLGANHSSLAALAQAHGVRAHPQFAAGARVLEYDGRVRRYRGLIPSIPLPAVLDLGLTLWRLNRKARTLSADAPWTAPRAAKWDAQSLEAWKRRHVRSRGARTMLDLATRAILCAEPSELSLLYFLDYVRASGSIEYLAGTTNGAQALLFEGGLHQLSTRMAAQLGDRVITDAAVQRIASDDCAVTIASSRGSWRARRVIVATSPALVDRIEFEPPLPPARRALHGAMKMGSVIKVHVAYEKPFWRYAGYTGEAVSDRDGFGPVFDGNPADTGSIGVLSGFFDAAPARHWSGHTQAERRAHVVECLVRWFGPQAAQPIDYVDQDWREEEWSTGCYTATMGPGVMTAYGAALRAPCDRVHWAGTETATRGTGYFEGALTSGARAAAEVLEALDPRGKAVMKN